MDEQLTHKMLTVVHDPKWDVFQEWLDAEEKTVNREVRRATQEGLLVMQGKLQFIDRLRELKDNIMVASQMYEQQKQMDSNNG